MATVLRTSLNPILAAIATKLVTGLGLSTNQVRSIAHWPAYATANDVTVSLWPRAWQRDPTWSDGSGRLSTKIDRDVWLVVDVRLSLDEVSDDESWLTDLSLGTIQYEESIQNILDDENLFDSDNNAYLIDPMKVVSGGPPIKDDGYEEPPPEGYGRTILSLRLSYQLNVDPTVA